MSKRNSRAAKAVRRNRLPLPVPTQAEHEAAVERAAVLGRQCIAAAGAGDHFGLGQLAAVVYTDPFTASQLVCLLARELAEREGIAE